jgi:hypothetical protein
MKGLFALNTYSDTVTTRQIDGSECQLDSLSCWHDNGDCDWTTPVPFDVTLLHIFPQAFGVRKRFTRHNETKIKLFRCCYST